MLLARRWSMGLIELGIITQGASFVAIAKAPAERINAWAKQRGWSQIWLVSGSETPYLVKLPLLQKSNASTQICEQSRLLIKRRLFSTKPAAR